MEVDSVLLMLDHVLGLRVKEVRVVAVEVPVQICGASLVTDEVTFLATVQRTRTLYPAPGIEIETDLLVEVHTEMGAKRGKGEENNFIQLLISKRKFFFFLFIFSCVCF